MVSWVLSFCCCYHNFQNFHLCRLYSPLFYISFFAYMSFLHFKLQSCFLCTYITLSWEYCRQFQIRVSPIGRAYLLTRSGKKKKKLNAFIIAWISATTIFRVLSLCSHVLDFSCIVCNIDLEQLHIELYVQVLYQGRIFELSH